MSAAVRSSIDASVARLLRAHRRAVEREADQKLALLRRLERQKVIRDLPETRIEQSFNEQLFARILGYKTLLSHDGAEFNLLPKNAAGRNRFDDFSIGFFGGSRDVVLGSAEFKGPAIDLDSPQTGGSYGGCTPVEQAFSAASGLVDCRWVLVSNFRELRLYSAAGTRTPIAVADLHEIRSRDDLGDPQAHFDRNALLPQEPRGTPAMSLVHNGDYAGSPLPAEDRAYRVVARFMPTGEERIKPLHALEHAVRASIDASPDLDYFFRSNEWEAPRIALQMRDGWVWAEASPSSSRAVRVAASRLGHVVVSARFGYGPHQKRVLFSQHVARLATLFVGAVIGMHGFKRAGISPGPTLNSPMITGQVGVELREVRGAAVERAAGASCTNVFQTEESDLFAGEFGCTVPEGIATATAQCLCDLAIQFRGTDGGLVLPPETEAQDLLKMVNGEQPASSS